ncbi:MAG: type II toxin-antitoxin system HicA family toxin [bacterium]|nr:type II toxin-antitoxin system HicA family toxin [bacterium]
MKRRDLEQHLRKYKCHLLREGSKHSVYHNMKNGQTSTVPRHTEIFSPLVRKICKDLGIPPPRNR